jgi:hypothetical protein
MIGYCIIKKMGKCFLILLFSNTSYFDTLEIESIIIFPCKKTLL